MARGFGGLVSVPHVGSRSVLLEGGYYDTIQEGFRKVELKDDLFFYDCSCMHFKNICTETNLALNPNFRKPCTIVLYMKCRNAHH